MNIGLIGCGWVSQFYGQLVGAMDESCSFAWAADTDIDRARSFCERFGGLPFASYTDAPIPDAYIVATPHHLHAPAYLDIARHGKPVLMEKPLALSVAECDRLIAERDRVGGLLMVAYVNRYRRAPAAVKAALERGDIGQPLFADFTQFGDQEKYVGGWILKRETLGGGCFFSSAGHLLDLASWLLGPIERIRLETASYRLPMEGEDTALALVRFQGGALATVRESWCAQAASHWQQFTIFGSGGSIEMTYTPQGPVPEWHRCLWDAKVVLRSGDSYGQDGRILYQDSAPFEFRGQLEHFLDCIAGQKQPLTTAESAREIIRLVRAAEDDLRLVNEKIQ